MCSFQSNFSHGLPALLGNATAWIDRQKGCEFYFSPVTIKPGSETTTKADMLSSEWVWADLDPRDGRPLDAERAEMLFLLTIDLPIDVARPTFIVDSGRGYWAFWRLEAPHHLRWPGR
jgi:hypothetical protein